MKRSYIFILIIVLAVVGVIGASIYEYQHRAKVTPGTTSQQALNERQDALKALAIHDAVNKSNLDAANAQITTLTSQKATLCTQIKTAKLVNPLCP